MRVLKNNAGFTLVELSIVLVIIGLIVSSVLVGQDLVRQAELRGTVTQYEQYQAAVKTFQTKYNALPGDTTGAASYGWTGNGNNDGVLEVIADGLGGTAADDNVYFWSHLGASGAGLISGTWVGGTSGSISADGSDIATSLPTTKAGNYWGVHSESGVNYYVIGVAAPGGDGEFDTALTLLATDALSIDTKLDDGRPGRGIVVARGAYNNATAVAVVVDSAAPTDTGSGCTYEDGANSIPDERYNTAESSVACTLRLRF